MDPAELPSSAARTTETAKSPENPTAIISSDADSSLEAQILHFLDSISQWWQRLKEPQPLEPITVVILGKVFEKQSLESPVIAAAMNLRIWFTYRCGFEPIKRADNGPAPLSFLSSMILNLGSAKSLFGLFDNLLFHSDIGWGCMIRTSQSLLANTLQRLIESTETTTTTNLVSNAEKEKEIIQLFGDNYQSPFSLHNFVKAASQSPLEVKPGEWFGPSAASLSIKRLCGKYFNESRPQLRVHVSGNSDLCTGDIASLFDESSTPLLVLLPIRLGIEKVNSYYYPSIFELLSLPQSIGIVGGKPSSSYYFVGYAGNDLLYLDPHNLQVVSEDPDLYHTSRCQTLPVSSLDPLMLVGILLLDMEDYLKLKSSLGSTNKIISFHDQPVKKTVVGEEYIRINSQSGLAAVDDYVDVSDHFLGEEFSLDDSIDKFDMVELPS